MGILKRKLQLEGNYYWSTYLGARVVFILDVSYAIHGSLACVYPSTFYHLQHDNFFVMINIKTMPGP